MSKKILSLVLITISMSTSAFAAKYSGRASQSDYSPKSYGSSSAGHMTLDMTALYIRDTKSDGKTDSALRATLGGMFSSIIGLDFVGLYANKSKDYLVGANLKLMPTDWFFIKGGVGAYADKQTRSFQGTPLVGTGIMANLGDGYFLSTEFMHFEKSERKNIGIGAGFGISF